MGMSPSREVASCAATQTIFQHLMNPKAHYRVQEPSIGLYPEPDQSSS
jgi:hypothetical protein